MRPRRRRWWSKPCRSWRLLWGAGLAASGDRPTVRVTLELGGPRADPLRRLPNCDQAYRILPDRGGLGVRVVALHPRGLYYGAKALGQLAAAPAGGGRVSLPSVASPTGRTWRTAARGERTTSPTCADGGPQAQHRGAIAALR